MHGIRWHSFRIHYVAALNPRKCTVSMPPGAHGSSLERACIGTDIISSHSVRLIRLAEKKWRPSGWRWGSSWVGQVGKWTWQERVRQDGGGDRRTGRAVSRAGRNQAVIQAWQLDWQAPVRKDTQALCPRTAVHPLISDGSKLFFFLFLKHDNKSEARLAALPMWSDQSGDELRTACVHYVFSEIQRSFWLKWWHVARSGDHS